MGWNEIGDSLCPVARALSVVGDRWTLLILRDLGMGVHRFEELQALTGMSSHLLATRLQRLSRDGIVEWRLYCDRPQRYEYFATSKGKELDAVLLALQVWGVRWGQYKPAAIPPVRIVSSITGEEVTAFWQAPKPDHPFTYDDTRVTISDAFRAEREDRHATFLRNRHAARAARRVCPGSDEG